jgi:hypothetical protein
VLPTGGRPGGPCACVPCVPWLTISIQPAVTVHWAHSCKDWTGRGVGEFTPGCQNLEDHRRDPAAMASPLAFPNRASARPRPVPEALPGPSAGPASRKGRARAKAPPTFALATTGPATAPLSTEPSTSAENHAMGGPQAGQRPAAVRLVLEEPETAKRLMPNPQAPGLEDERRRIMERNAKMLQQCGVLSAQHALAGQVQGEPAPAPSKRARRGQAPDDAAAAAPVQPLRRSTRARKAAGEGCGVRLSPC